MKRILLVASNRQYEVGSFLRKAFPALPYQFCFVDDAVYSKGLSSTYVGRIYHRILGRPLYYRRFNQVLLHTALQFQPDLLLTTKGSYISAETLWEIKARTNALLVNYATDDPFNPRNSTPDILSAIPIYDLYACTKRAIMSDVKKAGCKSVAFVPFGYEPSMHYPEKCTSNEEQVRFAGDLAFIGGADSDRSSIFRRLAAENTVSLALYGGYWDRDRALKRYHRGTVYARDYRLALGESKICLGLVRRANRDGHSMRTFEIPACGGFMIAERTEEHLEFFEEDKEVAFFGSDDELIDKIRYYIRRDKLRRQMADAARKRLLVGHNTYCDRLTQILEKAQSIL
jgi:spore maturation protein CgeB